MNVLLFILGLIIILPALLQTDGEEYDENFDVGGDIVLWDNLNRDEEEYK